MSRSSRREFMRLAAALGLSIPLSACGNEKPPPHLPADDEPAPSLGPELLAAGLVALGEAHRRRWNQGHHGAAVIAACYFCEENALDQRTTDALRRQVEAFMKHRRGAFADVDPGTGRADPEAIVTQLAQHVGELRSGGHDAIYAALALRVLRDRAELATPKVVDGVCALLRKFVETVPEQPPTERQRAAPPALYDDTRHAARATLDALLRPWAHVEQVGAGNVVHWVTHADALITLAELGFEDVARSGYAAHARYMDQPLGSDTTEAPDAPTIDWLAADYWESDAPRSPQKGTWFFGHAFKLPYSLFRLLREDDDPDRRDACFRRASQLPVPFP